MAAAPATRRMLAVWVASVGTIVVSVLQRSSLASAGLVATQRFHISAAQLGTFVTYQLLIYTVLQVPTGLLVDRFGPRRVVLAAMAVITAAGTGFAFVDTYGGALAARAAIGIGDAMVMVAVIRIVTAWFPPRWVGLATILSGVLGQLGGIGAAFLAPLLGRVGWTSTYLLVASCSALAGLVVALVVQDAPRPEPRARRRVSWRATVADLRAAWSEPATRLGLSVHFSTQFSATTFVTLWGFPFLVKGEGRSSGEASLLLAFMLVALMSAGPVIAILIARHPRHRSLVAVAIVCAIAAAWTVTLLWRGPAPLWLLACLVAVTGAGGPSSLIGFDIARSGNRPDLLGTVNGIVNQGGFFATLILVVAVGVILDLTTTGPADWSLHAFRLAMSFQYLLWGWGLFWMLRLRRLNGAHQALMMSRTTPLSAPLPSVLHARDDLD